MIHTKIDAHGIALITWDLEGSANVLNTASVAAFSVEVENALANEAVIGIVVASGKDHFVLGGDLQEIYALPDVATTIELGRNIHRVFRRLETGEKPVAVAINGLALGGGLELCLACHYRVALNSSRVQLGFPEANLGLLPGAGGTQRFPRLVGLQASLLPLLTSRNMRPEEALKIGLVNELAETPEAVLEAARNYILKGGTSVQPWDVRGFSVPGLEMASAETTFLYAGTAGVVRKRTNGNYPSGPAILDCLYEGLQMNFDQALEVEIRHFANVAQSKEAHHMIRSLFFNMNKAKGGSSRPKDQDPNPVKKLGVLGAGMMGAGIAYASAKAGIPVVLKDVTAEAAEKGKDYTRNLLQASLEKGRTTQAKMDAVLALIQPTTDAADLAGCGLVIEAVFEDTGLKAQVIREVEAVLPEGAVFASNTSTLPITGLATASKNAANFIGLHFFSPVDKMQLVEVILGEETSDYALAKSIDFIQQIKKVPIVVNDSRGFFASRIFKTFLAEGLEMLSEGVKPALIENAAKQVGMPVGPLAVADAVSLDLLYDIRKQYEKEGIVEQGAIREVIYKMVDDYDRKGKKAGKGFYEYPEGRKKRLWKGLAEHFPVAEVQPNVAEVKRRILHAQAIESVRCLESGVLRKPEDADIGSILGWGFPAYTGGVISYIDFVGVAKFVAECDDLANRYGERFTPTTGLREMAAKGSVFFPEPTPAAV